MHIVKNLGHVVGGTLLIAATTIGVGMLALPVATGGGGFIPAALIYIMTWFFMLCTGLLLLEVCIWMPKEANLITMTHRLLGPVGQAICWVVYLFLFCTAMIAHVTGGGGALSALVGGDLSGPASMIIYVLMFSPIVYLGTRSVDRFNLILMTGVLISYFLFIVISAGHVDLQPTAGNVGIGTLYPTSKLHMSSGTLTIDGNTANSIIASGKVGIGTTNPLATLDVVGGIGAYSRTIDQLLAITPGAVGQQYFCNNCSPVKMVVSTGTSAGNFADIMGGTFK